MPKAITSDGDAAGVSIDQFLATLGKKHQIRVDFLGAKTANAVAAIRTGALSVDVAIGIGGIPRGRITEIYGTQGAGKTTLCASIAAQAQKYGYVLYIDTEQAFDLSRAARLGVQIETLAFVQPDTAEQALDIAIECARSGRFAAIILDSVATLNPQAMAQGQVAEAHVGLIARLMSNALRIINPLLQQHQTAFILVNQLRSQIGVMYGSSDITPGGRALGYYASVRLECKLDERIKEGEMVVAQKIRITVTKNKVGPPYRKAYMLIYLDDPEEIIATAQAVLEMGLLIGYLRRAGSHYYLEHRKLGASQAEAIKTLRMDNELRDQIEKAVLQVALAAQTHLDLIQPNKTGGHSVDETPVI